MAPTENRAPAETARQEGSEDPGTSESVIGMLTAKGIEFQVSTHEAVRTSEQAAAVRGATLASGAKAMLVKAKPKQSEGQEAPFLLAVMSANKKLSWKLLKKALGVKDVRLATEEEVWELSRCRPGAVPPFGSAFGVQTLMDPSLRDQGNTINFNCGLKTKSISMGVADYCEVEQPREIEFCE